MWMWAMTNDITKYVMVCSLCSVRPQTGCGHMPFWAFENFSSSSSFFGCCFCCCPQVKWNSRTMVSPNVEPKNAEDHRTKRPNIWRRFKVNSNESTFTSATLTRARALDAIHYCQNQIKTINPCRSTLLFINCHRIDSIIDAHTHRVILTLSRTHARSLVPGGFIDPRIVPDVKRWIQNMPIR